jgi:mannosyltransferase OCH1-like enzyme
LIPRLFHQIWLGREPFPAEFARRQATWLAHHPGWDLRFWTEENLPASEELRRIEALERLRTPLERTDVLRLEVLWRFGGLYVDVDLECLRSIERLIADATFVAARARRGRLDTAMLGAVAAHPILSRALDEIQPREFPGYDKSATGSRFLDRLLADGSGVTYIDRELITAPSSREAENAYAVRPTGYGDTLDRVWQSVLKAEKRATAAQREAAAWQAKYEQVARVAPPERSSQAVRTGGRATAAGNHRNRVRMPRIFHQIWLGPNPLPNAFAAYQKTWLRHHPDWELRLWTEDNLPNPLRRAEAAERLRIPAERANILRLEVVWRFGGVYLDTDLECLCSIEPLIEDTDFFTVLRGSGVTDNYFFGAVPGHPILDRGLAEIKPQKSYGHSKERTGPRFLNGLIANHRDEIQLLDAATCKRYATHHRHHARSDPESLRLDILKARLEILEATHAGKA